MIGSYLAIGRSWDGLRDLYPQLSEVQLKAVLSYYEVHPDEINQRIAEEDESAVQALWQRLPITRPPHR